MSLFEKFTPLLTNNAVALSGTELPKDLLMSSEGNLQTFYAPFDYINTEARITICGVTPGMQQAVVALNEARRLLNAGVPSEEAKRKAKETASFAGAMRTNLINLLDSVGIAELLGINSCARLFDSHTHLVHYTSALRYPVFIRGENYNGTPKMLKAPSLRHQVDTYLAEEVKALSANCLYVPLGEKVSAAFEHLQSKGLVKAEQVLSGLPHPSPASMERINYFLGKKDRADLSIKTNPDKLDAARAKLLAKVAGLRDKGWS